MSDLAPATTQRPEPFVEYHRDHPELDTTALRRFVTKWREMGHPELGEVWRDPGGGWIRWLWFKDNDGMHHCLWIPSLVNSKPSLTDDETKLLVYLRAGGSA
jgi:hypothetical protein